MAGPTVTGPTRPDSALRRRAVTAPTLWCAAVLAVFLLSLALPPVNLFSVPGSYLPVHLSLEFIALAVSVMVYALAWNLRDRGSNAQVMLLGWASLVVTLVGLAHALSFVGMPDFVTPSSSGKAINFWLVARFAAAAGLLSAAIVGSRRWNPRVWFVGVGLSIVLTCLVWWIGLYHADLLPTMFVEGQGLTTLKVVLEYVLVALYWTAAFLFMRRSIVAGSDEGWLAAASWTLGLAELFFTLYFVVSDLNNLLGHVYLVIAYGMIYQGVFAAGVRQPYVLLAGERTLFRTLIDAIPDIVILKDADGRYRAANVAAQAYVGLPEEQIVGHRDADLFPGPVVEEIQRLDQESLASQAPTHAQVVRPDPETGTMLNFESVRIPLVDEQGVRQGVIGLHRNITEQLRTNDHIQELANFDQLTHLPNKALLGDRFTQAAHHADRQHESIAFVVIDVDDFKSVNDTLGHAAGDQVLLEVVSRLRGHMREGDTVARLDGDAFALLLRDADEGGAALVTQRMLEQLRHPYSVGGLELLLSATAGVSIFPTDGSEYDALYRCAETALHEAKREGRGTARFFSTEQQERVKHRLELLAALAHAVPNGELHLCYQPQLRLDTGDIEGFEALVRWDHPTLGLIAPSDFIPLAEQSSLILDIGLWTLDRAVRDAVEWQRQHGFVGRMSVNVSAVQLHRGDLVADVERVLAQHGLPPSQLTLELTETTAMKDPLAAIDIMQRLHALGIHVAIDDFGTGYSSMAYLKRFDASAVKIDASFVRALPDDANDAAIVRAIVGLSRSLSSTTCAEGVETPEQLEFLRASGCEVVQGYLIGKPMPANQVIEFLHRHSRGVPAAIEH